MPTYLPGLQEAAEEFAKKQEEHRKAEGIAIGNRSLYNQAVKAGMLDMNQQIEFNKSAPSKQNDILAGVMRSWDAQRQTEQDAQRKQAFQLEQNRFGLEQQRYQDEQNFQPSAMTLQAPTGRTPPWPGIPYPAPQPEMENLTAIKTDPRGNYTIQRAPYTMPPVATTIRNEQGLPIGYGIQPSRDSSQFIPGEKPEPPVTLNSAITQGNVGIPNTYIAQQGKDFKVITTPPAVPQGMSYADIKNTFADLGIPPAKVLNPTQIHPYKNGEELGATYFSKSGITGDPAANYKDATDIRVGDKGPLLPKAQFENLRSLASSLGTVPVRGKTGPGVVTGAAPPGYTKMTNSSGQPMNVPDSMVDYAKQQGGAVVDE